MNPLFGVHAQVSFSFGDVGKFRQFRNFDVSGFEFLYVFFPYVDSLCFFCGKEKSAYRILYNLNFLSLRSLISLMLVAFMCFWSSLFISTLIGTIVLDMKRFGYRSSGLW